MLIQSKSKYIYLYIYIYIYIYIYDISDITDVHKYLIKKHNNTIQDHVRIN